MKRHLLTAAAAGVAMMLGAGGSANAAEIKVIASTVAVGAADSPAQRRTVAASVEAVKVG